MTDQPGSTRGFDPLVVVASVLAVLLVATAIVCWLVLRQPGLEPVPIPSVSIG